MLNANSAFSYPAIVVGGPPHSGKSVLGYSLSQFLRNENVLHFYFRAAPDGEGDFSSEAPQELVSQIRTKGKFTPEYIKNICTAVERRLMPLIVDMGGKPTPEQQVLLTHCTHGIIISSDPDAIAWWQERYEQFGVTTIAILHSQLEGEEEITCDAPILQGRITGLQRGKDAKGILFERLAWLLRNLFSFDQCELRKRHLSVAPSTTLELNRLGQSLDIENSRWKPSDLPAVLDYLPKGEPLSIYDRGPNWLYGAIANHVCPAPLHQFDPILGWVAPISCSVLPDARPAEFTWEISAKDGRAAITFKIAHGGYLDYHSLGTVELPDADLPNELILDGKIPLWLVTALVYAYQDVPLLAFFQPQQTDGPVVVRSTLAKWAVGDLV